MNHKLISLMSVQLLRVVRLVRAIDSPIWPLVRSAAPWETAAPKEMC